MSAETQCAGVDGLNRERSDRYGEPLCKEPEL